LSRPVRALFPEEGAAPERPTTLFITCQDEAQQVSTEGVLQMHIQRLRLLQQPKKGVAPAGATKILIAHQDENGEQLSMAKPSAGESQYLQPLQDEAHTQQVATEGLLQIYNDRLELMQQPEEGPAGPATQLITYQLD